MAKQVGETTVNSALMGFAFSAAGASKKAVVNSINTNIENTISRLQTQVNSNIDTTKIEPNKIDALIPNDNGIKLDEDKVIAGMWEDSPNNPQYSENTNVEKSRLKNDEKVDNDINNWYNVVSQAQLVNLGSYKKIENIWSRALKKGKKVGVDIKVEYDGNSMRPSTFIVNYTIDGITTKKTIHNKRGDRYE